MQTESTVTIALNRYKELENYENFFNGKGIFVADVTYRLDLYNRSFYYVDKNQIEGLLHSTNANLQIYNDKLQSNNYKWKQIETFTKSKLYKVLVKLKFAPKIS